MFSTIVFITLVAFSLWRLIVEHRTGQAMRAGGAGPTPTDPAEFRVDPCTELPTRSTPAARPGEGTVVARLLEAGSTVSTTAAQPLSSRDR